MKNVDKLGTKQKLCAISVDMRSADSFQSEAVKRLEAFYDYGNENGRYSNAELSRIMSCIEKIKAIPLYCE